MNKWVFQHLCVPFWVTAIVLESFHQPYPQGFAAVWAQFSVLQTFKPQGIPFLASHFPTSGLRFRLP